MALSSGTRLGPYRVDALLGTGGMGEVYRATDTRLERTVAIKILPEAFAADEQWQSRFSREARIIASLDHPHICGLYDVGTENGIEFLVMQYLEGQTLADRLASGPLELRAALQIAVQLAAGLAAAHRAGVVHRDLKPGNVMLTKTGVKLLDFGLAKPSGPPLGGDDHPAPTMTRTSPLTAAGSIIGTLQYMAPEQLEGRDADARTDIFALGLIVYEMITGGAAFTANSQAGLIATILTQDPPPLVMIEPLTPAMLDAIVRRCLAKDREERWQSAQDLLAQLQWLFDTPGSVGTGGGTALPPPRARWRGVPLLLTAAVVGVALFALGMMFGRGDRVPDAAPAIRASITPPAGTSFQFLGDNAGPAAITRDGSKVVFGAGDDSGVRRLYVRELNGTFRALRGTEGGMFPFWSPDGRSIGFFAFGSLRRVDDSGGEVVTLAPARDARGGSWANDTILFAPDINDGIWAIPASGGKARQITTVDTSRHTTHRWPVFLADGDRFLYFAAAHAGPARVENSGVFSARLTANESSLLLRTGARVAVAGDQLFYLRDGSLYRQHLNTAGALTLDGEATRVVSRVFSDHTTWSVLAAAADTGVLVFVTGAPAQQALAVLDPKGAVLRTLAESESYRDMRLSPDGTKIAFIADSPASPNGDLWVYDIKRGFRTRLTFDAFGNTLAWSPDSSQIAYGAGMANHGIFVIRADGAGGPRVLHSDPAVEVSPRDWSADGKYLLYERGSMPRQTLWALPLHSDPKPFPPLGGDFDHFDGRISPDGRWLAYTSREAGASQVIVTTFPKATGKWQVHTTGASAPQWADNGRTLRFLTEADRGLHEARLDVSSGVPVVESVRALMRPPFALLANSRPLFEFLRDGTLIAMIAQGDARMQLHVLSNWRAAAAIDEQ